MPRTDRGARTDNRQRAALQALRPALETTATRTADLTARYGELVVCDPTGGALTVTLPLATDHRDELVAVKNAASSGNAVTVAADGSETIDGGASVTVADRECVWCQSTGSEWILV